jgi:hypothetical protein
MVLGGGAIGETITRLDYYYMISLRLSFLARLTISFFIVVARERTDGFHQPMFN